MSALVVDEDSSSYRLCASVVAQQQQQFPDDEATPRPLREWDLSKLPLPCEVLPSHVNSLKDCARHQIRALLALEGPHMTLDDEDAIDDGFVVCDLNVVCNKFEAWRRLFPRLRPFFALKCNPDPMVAAVLGQLGAGFDCASVPEIQLALASSSTTTTTPGGRTPQSSLIYANPQRAEKDLDTALQLHVQTLTFDGPEELRKVHRAYQKLVESATATSSHHVPNPPDMVLRILVPDKHSTVPLGEKFGVPPSQIEPLAELAAELGLGITGISFHCGSGNHDPEAYKVAIELATNAAHTIEQVFARKGVPQRCWLLDIGGGFPGRDGMGADAGRFVGNNDHAVNLEVEREGETALKIAQSVGPVLHELYPPPSTEEASDEAASTTECVKFIAEPGRYFVEAAFALCSRIYRVRIEEGPDGSEAHRHYYIGQGVQGVFKDCILCGESFLPEPYALDPARESRDPVVCTIHGPSGEDYDVVCRDYPLPPLEIGDWLLFDRMGAYTLSIAARSGRPSIRYVIGGSRLPPIDP